MFFGSIPALVTPFSGGRVAEDTFADFVEWQIAEGSNALVPCGTTGEVATLERAEHHRLIEVAVDAAGRMPGTQPRAPPRCYPTGPKPARPSPPGQPGGGKSGLRRAGCWVTPRRYKPPRERR